MLILSGSSSLTLSVPSTLISIGIVKKASLPFIYASVLSATLSTVTFTSCSKAPVGITISSPSFFKFPIVVSFVDETFVVPYEVLPQPDNPAVKDNSMTIASKKDNIFRFISVILLYLLNLKVASGVVV